MVCYHGKNNEINRPYCEKCPVNHDCLSCSWDITQHDRKTEQTKSRQTENLLVLPI